MPRSLLPVHRARALRGAPLPLLLLGLLGLLACDDAPTFDGPRASSAAPSATAPAPVPSAGASAYPTFPLADAAAAHDQDIELRISFARRHLGGDPAVHVEAGLFVMVSAADSPAFQEAIALTQKAMAAYYNGRFATRPQRPVTVYILPSKEAFESLCIARLGARCDSDFGEYVHETREIFVNVAPGVTTLTHELVHPLIEADFPQAPLWLNEGIAALYEAPVFPQPGEIRGVTNWRLPTLKSGFADFDAKDVARLNRFFGDMRDGAFHGPRRALAYAAARYVCQWLDSDAQKQKLWPFYHAWRDHFSDDPLGVKAFTQVVGKAPSEANDEWQKWVQAL